MRSRYEIRTQKELEANGWLIDWKIRPSGWKTPRGYNVDFFGLFDLFAYKDGLIRMIAVKGHGGVPATLRKAIENFKVCRHVAKEIWYYRKVKGSGRKSVPKKETI